MSGTEIACGTARDDDYDAEYQFKFDGLNLSQVPYAMSGTDVAYGGTLVSGSQVSYAMSGTDVA
eukprot:3913831-Rhodomonas_salina.1